jgi:PKD repeat protein
MKYIIYTLLLLVTSYTTFSQKPFNQDPSNPNLDFSLGNFNNWQLSWGNRGTPYTNSGVVIGANSHTIIEVYGTNWDGNAGTGNLKRVPDGLKQVARLGAPAGGGYGNPKSYAMKYHITVNAAYPILFFQLASIMDITHGDTENTNYQFSVKNTSGTYLFTQPCAGIQLTPRGRNFNPSSNVYTLPTISAFGYLPEIGSILYQPWESVALDLSAYIGQTITIAYEHSDCYTGHHGSYTSIAAAMRSPYNTFYFCRGAATTTIKPYQPNFHTYLWNTGATTDSLFISNPTDGAIYNCTVGSYNGCQATFTYILKEIKTNADFHYVGGNTCNQIQFLDQSLTNMGKMVKWHWDFGDPASGVANVDTMQNPLHIYPSPGNYTVSLTVTDTFGCTNTITKTVSVSPEGTVAQIGLPNPSCVYAALPFEDITSNSSRRIWYIEEQKINDTSKIVYHSFSQPGTYEVMLIAIGSNGCPDTTTQSFQVYGLPQSAIQVIPQTLAAPVTDPEISVQRLGRKRH